MKLKLQIFLQYITPQHLLSRVVGFFANCKQPWFKNAFITWFIRHYSVDMNIALQPDSTQYPTFNSFFTRYLKATARPLNGDHNTIISPCDGTLCQLGPLQNGRLIQAKNFDYSVLELMGCTNTASLFAQGSFMTIYLAPKDYHRVHMPLAGRLLKMIYIPGALFSVNTETADNIPRLFTRNERVICLFETHSGPMAVVFVGAMIVASISTVWSENITPNGSKTIRTWDYQDQNIQFNRGAEIGHFKLGSTVIVLFPNNQLANSAVRMNNSVQFGQKICDLALSKACAML